MLDFLKNLTKTKDPSTSSKKTGDNSGQENEGPAAEVPISSDPDKLPDAQKAQDMQVLLGAERQKARRKRMEARYLREMKVKQASTARSIGSISNPFRDE